MARNLGTKLKIEKKSEIKDYEHRREMTTLLKIIYETDMDDMVKMIMRCRIWGKDPKVFNPMTAEQIARDCLKFKEPSEQQINEIKQMEQFGVFACKQHLLSKKSVDIVEGFNKNFDKNKAEMFASGFERKRFSV